MPTRRRRRALAALAPAAAVIVATTGPIAAQEVLDRVGELKAWREQCNDPDPDLRAAYVEAALESKDTAVARICIRQALASTNVDIRNLGLRAAIAGADRIVFSVTPPEGLAAALAKVDDQPDKLRPPYGYMWRHWKVLETGLPIEVAGDEVASSTSIWYPLAGLSGRRDNISGEATITGDAVTWVGSVGLPLPNDCAIAARLTEDSRLAGTLKCGSLDPFGISAELL